MTREILVVADQCDIVARVSLLLQELDYVGIGGGDSAVATVQHSLVNRFAANAVLPEKLAHIGEVSISHVLHGLVLQGLPEVGQTSCL